MPTTINGTTGVSQIQDGAVSSSAKIANGAVAQADLDATNRALQCKAWANFDGRITGTNAPRAGFNIPSITRNGAGDYTISITAGVLADANYVVFFSCPNRTDTTVNHVVEYSTDGVLPATKTQTSLRIAVRAGSNNSGADTGDINVAIFGN